MRYTFFQLFLYEAEPFLTDVNLSFSFRLVTIWSRVLFCVPDLCLIASSLALSFWN
jgi:hypothetical protein